MVAISTQALMTAEIAKRYLRDQGLPADDGDMLRLHINAVSGFIVRVTGRSRLIYSATAVEEIRDGFGHNWMYTREAPIKSLTSIETYPYATGVGETLTGPGTSLGNDDMWYDSEKGRIVLLNRTFPEGIGTVKITYEAGWYDDGDGGAGVPADDSLSALRVIALEALLRKWQRWTEKRVGVTQRSSDAGSVSYSADDFSKSVMTELARYRRRVAV